MVRLRPPHGGVKAEEECAAVRAAVRGCVYRSWCAFEKGGKKEGGRKVLCMKRRRRRRKEKRKKGESCGGLGFAHGKKRKKKKRKGWLGRACGKG